MINALKASKMLQIFNVIDIGGFSSDSLKFIKNMIKNTSIEHAINIAG